MVDGCLIQSVPVVFFYFYFFAQRLTTVKHAFGVECRPGRSVFSYDCIKVSLGPNIPMYDKKISSSCIACNGMEYYSCTFVF